MWELYTGHAAFRKLHMRQFYEAVILRNLRPLVPPAMPRDYQLLMERCWASGEQYSSTSTAQQYMGW